MEDHEDEVILYVRLTQRLNNSLLQLNNTNYYGFATHLGCQGEKLIQFVKKS